MNATNFENNAIQILTENVWRVESEEGHGTRLLRSLRYPIFVTCAHVVENQQVVALTKERHVMYASVVYVDYSRDIALLRPDGSRGVLPMPCSSMPRVGQPVFTAGFPNKAGTPQFGQGFVSGNSDVRLAGAAVNVLTLALNAQPGRSGSPVCDEDNRVLGMLAAIDQANVLGLPVSNASNGITYAIKTVDILDAVHALAKLDSIAKKVVRKFEPDRFSIARADLAALQKWRKTSRARGVWHVFVDPVRRDLCRLVPQQRSGDSHHP
ncbi:MAG: serine protease [bacterium]